MRLRSLLVWTFLHAEKIDTTVQTWAIKAFSFGNIENFAIDSNADSTSTCF